MRLGLVNLITKTADLPKAAVPPFAAENLRPTTDCDINVVEFARRIIELGHEVHIFASDAFMPYQPCPAEKGLRIEYLPTSMKFVFPAAIFPFTPDLAKMLRNGAYDCILSTELFQSGTILTWFATRGTSTRIFIWQELDVLMRGPAGKVQEIYYRTLGRKVVSDVAGIITRSLSARKHLLENGVPEDKVAPEIVHSGVDCHLFRPLDKMKARERFGLQEFEDVILCVGRAHPNKGFDLMIKAMPRLLRERPNAVLVLKTNGPQLLALQVLAQKSRLENSIRFISEPLSRQDMPWLFNCADLLAITSRIDLFPFTAIEAISCGVPIATSFARGLKTDIVDKGAGFILPKDYELLGLEISHLLREKGKLREVGIRGRELAEAEFDFKISASRLCAALERGCA
ncbi:MAG: glycosyltransferase family 4 protein [Methanomassiliicoccales archaeon]